MSESPVAHEARERSKSVERRESSAVRRDSPPEDRDRRGRSRSGHGSPRRQSRSRDRDARRERERDESNGCVVYVAKLSRSAREADLKDAFIRFGTVKTVVMKQGFAFITYDKPESATEAIAKMNGAKFINGEELVVEPSVPGSRRKFNGPKKDDKCFKCNQTGHWANECRNGSRYGGDRHRRSRSRSGRRHSRSHSRDRRPPRDSYRRRSRSRSTSYRRDHGSRRDEGCFRCGKPGHIKVNCPEGPGRGGFGGRRTSPPRYGGADRERGYGRREERRHSGSRDREYRRRRSHSRSPNPER